MIVIIIVAVVAALVFIGFGRTVRIVPQARAYVVERLGSYSRTLDAGLNSVVPFIDRVRARVDLREQVVSFAPQPVITEDNLVVHIDAHTRTGGSRADRPHFAQGRCPAAVSAAARPVPRSGLVGPGHQVRPLR